MQSDFQLCKTEVRESLPWTPKYETGSIGQGYCGTQFWSWDQGLIV